MSRSSRFVLASCSSLLAAACHGSSGGGGAGGTDVERLRAELAAAGVQPLAPPPPVSPEMFALGQALFFDKILSGNEDVSCATCHLPEFSSVDGRTLPSGVHGVGLGPDRVAGDVVARNSPPLFELHLKRELLWDGAVQRFGDLVLVPQAVELTEAMRAAFSPGLEVMAAQAMLPPVARSEMRGQPGENPLADLGEGYNSRAGTPDSTARVWRALTERLLDLPGYLALLLAAYPDVPVQDFNFAHAGNAIAAFEAQAFARTDSPFERFVRGDDTALTDAQLAGALEFFGRAGCSGCHSGPLLSDEKHHNIGLPQLGPGVGGFLVPACPMCPGLVLDRSDIGRANVTSLPEDGFRFRTPSLLDVELTGPWGHAGQFAHLRDFVAHYRDAELSHLRYDIQANVPDPELVTTLVPNSDLVLASLDPGLRRRNDFDVDAVVEFLRALTAEDAADLSDIVPASVPSGLPIF